MKRAHLVGVLGAAVRAVRGADGDLAKVGVENINSDLATFIRTMVVVGGAALCSLRPRGSSGTAGSNLQPHLSVPAAVGARHRRVVAVLFPRAQTRRRGASGADRQLTVVLVAVFGVLFLGERASARELARHRARSAGPMRATLRKRLAPTPS